MNLQFLTKLAVLALVAGPLHANVLFGPVIAGPGKSIHLVSITLPLSLSVTKSLVGN